MMSYRAYQVTGQRQFALVERELRDPDAGQVRIRTAACGVCHWGSPEKVDTVSLIAG